MAPLFTHYCKSCKAPQRIPHITVSKYFTLDGKGRSVCRYRFHCNDCGAVNNQSPSEYLRGNAAFIGSVIFAAVMIFALAVFGYWAACNGLLR